MRNPLVVLAAVLALGAAAFLWPQTDLDRARQSLRAALPQRPGAVYLRVFGKTYRLAYNPSGVPVAAAASSAPAPVAVDVAAPDDMTLQRPPSLTAAQIDAILSSYNSPATGTGQVWIDKGVQYGIDPAYAVAFFIHESSAGTNSAWAGLKGNGETTHNIGNIICTGSTACYGRFRDYPSWDAGIEDWYKLIADEYIGGRGLTTLDQVLPIYAPSFENDVDGYRSAVAAIVAGWRKEQAQDVVAGATASVPIPVDNSAFGMNVRAALDANNGALRDVVIAPGATWSFNAAIGNPNSVSVVNVSGVPGGGWCDLASRYVQSVRPIPGIVASFPLHGVALNGVSYNDSVVIWNIDGQPGTADGREDLELTNTTTRPLHLRVVADGDAAVVVTAVVE